MDKKSVAFMLLFFAFLAIIITFYLAIHFFQNIHSGVLNYFLYIPLIILLGIVISGADYVNRNRDKSIFLSSIAITASIFVICGSFLFSHELKKTQSEISTLVNKQILQNKKDAGIIETPPAGFLIPGPDFAPKQYREIEHQYTKTKVIVVYQYIDNTNTKSIISYSERPVTQEFAKGIPKNKDIVYEFVYKGAPAAVRKSSVTLDDVPNSPGRTSFSLLRIRNERMIFLDAYNVIEKDFTPKTLEDMLYKLQVAE